MWHLGSILIFVSCMILASCGRKDAAPVSEKPVLCVSIEPQRKILSEIAGSGYEVVSLLGNGANPETFEPSVSQRMTLENSAAYFPVGYLPFEQRYSAALAGRVPVFGTSDGIEPVTGTHGHHEGGHGEAGADPHVWTSLRNGHVIADNMLRALVSLRPDSAEAYGERHAALVARLDSLDREAASRLAGAAVHGFAIWHPSLSYYARDYGLHQLSVGYESKDVSAGELSHVIEEARRDSVKVFFFQKEYDSRQARSINAEIGSRMVTIAPLAYDWDDEIMRITDELAR